MTAQYDSIRIRQGSNQHLEVLKSRLSVIKGRRVTKVDFVDWMLSQTERLLDDLGNENGSGSD